MSAPPELNHWHGLLTAAGPVAVDAVVKSVFWLAAAALVTSGMRRASAAARHFVWFLAVAGLFALPVLSWTLPGWDILPRWMEVKRSESSAPAKPLATVESQLPPIEQHDATGRPASSASLPVNTFSTSSSGPQEQIVEGKADKTLSARFSLRELWIAAWEAGFAFVLLRTLTGLAALWWLERGSRLETSSSWLELLRRLVAGLRLRRAVTLLKSHRRQMPMTWGVVRPKLLLPEDSEEWPEERRRVVLLHELAHARRWDYATNLLTRLACALWWFNPLVWLAARQMAAERERACDDIVLNHGAKPAEYAEQLLGIAARGRLGGWAEGVGIAMARPSKLEGRLRAILDSTRQRSAPARAAALLMLAASLLLVVPVAMIRAAPEPVPSAQNAAQATNRPGFLIVSGSVVDAETHQPIPEFTVTPGNALAGDFLFWETGLIQRGQRGRYRIELPASYQASHLYPIKVEAPGYLPEMSDLFDLHPNGIAMRDFELHKGEGFSGTVLGPDGRAVEDAQVAYKMRWGGLQFDGHKLMAPKLPAHFQQTPLVETDAQGHFTIPGKPGINSLIIFHEKGFAEIPRETLGQVRVIRLQPWTNMASPVMQPGFKVRLKTSQQVWPEGATPQLTAEIRNDGASKLLSSTNMRLWRIEVDGTWYGRPLWPGSLSEIKPDRPWTNVVVTLDGHWEQAIGAPFADTYGQPDIWDPYFAAPLTLSAGKHIIRLAVFAVDADQQTVGTIQAVSDSVDVGIGAPPPPPPGGKPQANDAR